MYLFIINEQLCKYVLSKKSCDLKCICPDKYLVFLYEWNVFLLFFFNLGTFMNLYMRKNSLL